MVVSDVGRHARNVTQGIQNMRKICWATAIVAVGIVGNIGCSDSREATAPDTFAPFPDPSAEKGSLGKQKGPTNQKPSSDDEAG